MSEDGSQKYSSDFCLPTSIFLFHSHLESQISNLIWQPLILTLAKPQTFINIELYSNPTMKPIHVTVLKQLGLRGALNEYIPISSGELARNLHLSQQSASKKILELIDEELIARQLGARKQLIKLTEKGLNVLRKEYSDYQRVFELADHITVRGSISSGMGDGQYYVTHKGYKDQFKSKLWFEPYKGTLNVKVTGSELSKFQILRSHEGIPIDSFTDGGRTFGKGKCFLCTVQGEDCAVMIPNRSHYDDVIEVLAKDYLRDKLALKDGDVVELRISL